MTENKEAVAIRRNRQNEDPRLKSLLAEFGKIQSQIRRNAEKHGKKATLNRRLHACTRAIVTILSVVAPTLVTYQIQAQKPDVFLSVITIIITAFAGALGALQGTFRWGDSYARSLQTQLRLLELEGITNLYKVTITHTSSSSHRYTEIKAVCEQTLRNLSKILNEDIRAEVALATQEPQQRTPQPDSASMESNDGKQILLRSTSNLTTIG